MDTQLHSLNADLKNEDTTITNYQNFEEIFIKEEPFEENSQDCELYDKDLQSVKKECTIDTDNQIDEACGNSIAINNDIPETENTKSNSFCCTKCNKSFTRRSNLNKHLEIHEENKKFDCPVCEKICPPDSDIKIRTRRHIHCPTCHKLFTRKNNLNHHMKLHSGIKEHQCTVCYKSFTQNFNLKNHMKIHSGIMDFKCTICNKLFTHNSILFTHMRIHSDIRAYKCPTCNKSFKLNSNLKAHMKIHSERKDYKCEICNKRFTRSRNLTQHMRIHSGTKDFHCSMCGKLFTEKSDLKKHINRIHSC